MSPDQRTLISPESNKPKPMFYTELVKSDHEMFTSYWSELEKTDAMGSALHRLRGHGLDQLNTTERSTEPDYSTSAYPGCPAKDLSFILLEHGKPLFACSLTLTVNAKGLKKLGYSGVGASTYFGRQALNTDSYNLSTASLAAVGNHIHSLLNDIDPDIFEFEDQLNCGVLSPVSQCLIANGGFPEFSTAYTLDLTQSSRALMRAVSKANRSKIQWGQRHLKLMVHSDQFSIETGIQQGQALGGQAQLWHCSQNLRMLMRNRGIFLVEAYYQEKLVGTALFSADVASSEYLGCQLSNCELSQEFISNLIWKGVSHAGSQGCKKILLEHHFIAQSEELVNFAGFGGQASNRLKVVWRK